MSNLKSNSESTLTKEETVAVAKALADIRSNIKEDYVAVPRLDAWGCKVAPDFKTSGIGNPRSGPRGVRAAMKPIKVRLVFPNTAVATAAGAAFANVQACTPSGCADWAQFAAVYDECRVLGGELFWNVTFTTPAAGYTATMACAVYDPIDGTAPASVYQQMTFAQNSGPKFITCFPAGGVVPPSTTPASTNASGLHCMRFKVPTGSARSSANPTWFGKEWSSTVDGADIFGFLKLFCSAPAALAVMVVSTIYYLDMEFRSRQ
jgi:hypothetical protein